MFFSYYKISLILVWILGFQKMQPTWGHKTICTQTKSIFFQG